MFLSEIPCPAGLRRQMEAGGAENVAMYGSLSGCTVLVSRDPIEGAGPRWHLSMSHHYRLPTWQELGEARDELIPEDVWMMIPHPPRKYWLNYNPHVLHLQEFSDPPLQAHFQWEGEEAQKRGYGEPS